MNRLALKLTAAFIVVAVLAVGLVSYWANRATANEFASYVNYSAATPPPVLRNALARYYSGQGGWSGVEQYLQQLADLTGSRLFISDGSGRVVADSAGQGIGRTISQDEQALRVPLVVGGRTVGYLSYMESGNVPSRLPRGMGGMMSGMMSGQMWQAMAAQQNNSLDAPERSFLAGVKSSLWTAGLIAAALAAALGLLLVRQITQPLHVLTDAASRIARGELTHRVPVRSHDEIGQLASAFNAMADSLAKNEQLRRQLAADIAHELRTPLAVIQGNLEGMRDGVIAPTADKLASVHEESLLLARLISDLRELSLAEAGQLPLQLVSTDLVELATRAVQKVQSQAIERGISVVADVAPAVPLVPADPDRIGQVLHNLLSNALRHTPAGGRITVSVALDVPDQQRCDDGANGAAIAHPPSQVAHAHGWVKVRVADNGTGIASEDLPRVFDRFYRADKSRARASGGSGIGLAIVKQLVEAHGGQVWVTSKAGSGSAFCFVLPALETNERGLA